MARTTLAAALGALQPLYAEAFAALDAAMARGKELLESDAKDPKSISLLRGQPRLSGLGPGPGSGHAILERLPTCGGLSSYWSKEAGPDPDCGLSGRMLPGLAGRAVCEKNSGVTTAEAAAFADQAVAAADTTPSAPVGA